MFRCVILVILAAVFLLPGWIVPALGEAQEDAAKIKQKAAQKKQVKGRLPAYYPAIVNAEQRQRIYQIQATYNPKIESLQAELDALVAKRDAEIRGVLTPDQRQQLDARVAEAQAAKTAKKDGAKKVVPVKKAG